MADFDVRALIATMENDASFYVRYSTVEALSTITCKEVAEPTQTEIIADLYKQVMKSADDLETTLNFRQVLGSWISSNPAAAKVHPIMYIAAGVGLCGPGADLVGQSFLFARFFI